MTATDLQFATTNRTIVRHGGTRQEIVEALVAAFDADLAPPRLATPTNLQRLELEKELEPLRVIERKRWVAAVDAVEAEHRRLFDERLANAGDDEEHVALEEEMRGTLHEQRHEIEAEAARRVEQIQRAAAIRAELASIDRDERKVVQAMYLKTASAMRHALGTPTKPETIIQALDRLAGQHKWQSGADKRIYLTVLAEEIEAAGFCAAAVAKAVRDSARREPWVPGINMFLDACREVTRALWALVWMMESNDPTRYADLLFHRVEIAGEAEREAERRKMRKLAYNELRAFSGPDKDKAPGSYP